MEHDRLQAENETLRRRLARLTEAILSISEDLDVDAVLEEIVDSARSLTDARYSAITTLDDSGDLQDLLIAGMTPEEKQALMSLPEGWALFDYLTGFREPLRIADLVAHTRSVGFPDSHLPVRTLLGTRIHDREKHIGNIFIAEKEGGEDFTPDDEETLEMFATQAAMAITNARRYGDERRTNADLEALINTSPVGVLVFDAQTRDVVKCNREARRILGGVHGHDTAPEQLLKQTTFRWIDGRVIPRPQVPLARALRGGETVRAEEIVIQRADGATVTTLVNATPIRSDDDEIMSVVVTIQDITPLEELERLRAEFLGMVSHELRAPLTSIKGSAATVLDASGPLDPGEVRQFFRIIEEQADQMRDLINNLLDLTRIESGSLPIAPEPTDLAAVIDQARNVFGSGGHRNTIEVNLMPNLPRIVVDRQRILQVLYNLFSNASKFSREWSTIRVSASLEDPHVAVSVADEGVGIAAEHLPRLFSKFSRHYGEAGETHVDGYGFGLAICKGIVEAHGGRIRAVSDGPGQGTRFTFTVPVVDDTTDLVTAEAAPVAAGTGQAPLPLGRILVIDDDPQILRYIRNALSDAGHSPVLTADASEVDHLLETESPDLVLLNLVMPGADGFELMRHILGTLDVPVIVVSGRGGDQYIAKAFEIGAADYVVKPFSPTELLARIRAALRRRAVSQQTAPYLVGELMIDYVERSVTLAGRPLKLTPTEYRLLFELSSNAGRVLSYDHLLQRVWGQDYAADAQRVRTFVKDLRRKLGDDARDPTYIFTEPGVGYRMAIP